jgi:hypothetical protein
MNILEALKLQRPDREVRITLNYTRGPIQTRTEQESRNTYERSQRALLREIQKALRGNPVVIELVVEVDPADDLMPNGN